MSKPTENYKVTNEQQDELMRDRTAGSQGKEFLKPIQKSKTRLPFLVQPQVLQL